MEIKQTTSSYNQRRYGKPWIATVDFTKSVKGYWNWGDWVGDGQNGGEGFLILDVNLGDIVAQGQKDFRKPQNSAPVFYIVDHSGNLDLIGDRGAAYKHYLSTKDDIINPFEGFSDKELIAEMERRNLS